MMPGMQDEPKHWRWQVRAGLLQGRAFWYPPPVHYGEYRFDRGLTAATVALASDPKVGPTFGDEVPIRMVEAPVLNRTDAGLRFALTFEVASELGGGDVVVSALPYAAMGSAMSARLKETDGRWRAQLVEPVRPAAGDRSANRFRGWTIGLCPSVRRAQVELLKCEGVQTMVRLTEARALKVGRGARYQVGPADVVECLSLLNSVVLLQALAGRGARKTERKRWSGRPVSELVRYIYEDHVNRLLRARIRAERPIDRRVDPDTGQRLRDPD